MTSHNLFESYTSIELSIFHPVPILNDYLVFLLANIFTGLTNVLIDTRAQPPLIGHLVMMVYLGTMCSVGYGIANNETVRPNGQSILV